MVIFYCFYVKNEMHFWDLMFFSFWKEKENYCTASKKWLVQFIELILLRELFVSSLVVYWV